MNLSRTKGSGEPGGGTDHSSSTTVHRTYDSADDNGQHVSPGASRSVNEKKDGAFDVHPQTQNDLFMGYNSSNNSRDRSNGIWEALTEPGCGPIIIRGTLFLVAACLTYYQGCKPMKPIPVEPPAMKKDAEDLKKIEQPKGPEGG